jgi:hypothetical protein
MGGGGGGGGERGGQLGGVSDANASNAERAAFFDEPQFHPAMNLLAAGHQHPGFHTVGLYKLIPIDP